MTVRLFKLRSWLGALPQEMTTWLPSTGVVLHAHVLLAGDETEWEVAYRYSLVHDVESLPRGYTVLSRKHA